MCWITNRQTGKILGSGKTRDDGNGIGNGKEMKEMVFTAHTCMVQCRCTYALVVLHYASRLQCWLQNYGVFKERRDTEVVSPSRICYCRLSVAHKLPASVLAPR